MDGVRVILSLFLLLASFSAAREERLAQRAWGKLTDAEQKTYNYLAFFKSETGIKCSGSILSESLVLTYCDDVPINCTVYAGKVEVPTRKTTNGDTQVRQVKTAVKDDKSGLSICVMNSNWKFNEYVGAVTLNDKSGLPQSKCSVLGFRATAENKIVAHKLNEQDIGEFAKCISGQEGAADHLYSKAAAEVQKLAAPDRGGPAVCDGDKQWGINVECKKVGPSEGQVDCNSYLSIFPHSEWIEKQKNATEEAGASGETGGNGNSTASSGYSIHSYLNKYSNWKVLWFLVPTIVTFLQY